MLDYICRRLLGQSRSDPGWDQTREADLRFGLRRRRYFIGIDPGIAKDLQHIAEAEGVSSETMANLWLQEKLQEKREEMH